MKQTPYVAHPQRTQIALAYRNESTDYIADLVFPRVQTADRFSYNVFDKGTFLRIPESKPIGRKGAVPEITGTGREVIDGTDDYALDEVVPLADIKAYQAGTLAVDPEETAAIRLADAMLIQRESRVANLVANPATYAPGNTIALSGSNKWTDPSSDPAKAIQTAITGMFKTPNTIAMGRAAYAALITHPKIVSAWNRSNGTSGLVPGSALADLLGVKEVLVGQAWGDIAAPGQTSNFVKLWGDSVALFYKSPITVDTRSATFGFTAQFEDITSLDFYDMNKGARGSNVQRLYQSVKEVVMAPDFGYLFQTTT